MAESNRRPLRHKPRERSFRFADYSKPMSKAPKDDYTISKRGPRVEIVRPKWTGSAPMTFRPLPMTCAEDPSLFDPTRLSTDEYDFSDFWRGLPAVKYVGIDQKFTFLLYDPRRVVEEGYDPRKDNPYHVLYNAIQSAVKEGEAIVNGRDVITAKWSPLIADNSSKKAFNAPTRIYYMQGLIYESDGELYIAKGGLPKGLRDGDLPQIIELSKSAGDQIARKLNMLNPEYTGDTDIEFQADMYLYGDVVDLGRGSFLTIYNPDKHHNVIDQFEVEEDGKEESSFVSWKAAINGEFEYIVKRNTEVVSGDLTEWEDQIRKLIVPWDEVLYFPSDEEICRWIAQAFRSMPSLLEFGWSDHQEFFTDEVQGILANRVQVSTSSGGDGEIDDDSSIPDIVPRASRPARSATASGNPSKPARGASVPVVEETVEEDYADDEYDDKGSKVVESDVGYDDDGYEDDYDADSTDTVESVDEEADYEDDEVEEEVDPKQAAREAAEAAKSRAALRTAAKVGPGGPPTAKPATKVPQKDLKPKTTTRSTPVRRASR